MEGHKWVKFSLLGRRPARFHMWIWGLVGDSSYRRGLTLQHSPQRKPHVARGERSLLKPDVLQLRYHSVCDLFLHLPDSQSSIRSITTYSS